MGKNNCTISAQEIQTHDEGLPVGCSSQRKSIQKTKNVVHDLEMCFFVMIDF